MKSSNLRWPFGRRWLFIPPILLGAAALFYMGKNRDLPKQLPIAEVARTLRIIEVPQVALVPRVLGYGAAQPADIWSAVAEVKGRVVAVHPELKAGAIIRADKEVLRIDPAEYELLIAQFKAEIAEIH